MQESLIITGLFTFCMNFPYLYKGSFGMWSNKTKISEKSEFLRIYAILRKMIEMEQSNIIFIFIFYINKYIKFS